MGWTSARISRSEVIASLTEAESFTNSKGVHVTRRTLAKKLVGNVMYTLEEQSIGDAIDRFVSVHLLRKDGVGWAWKSYTEHEGPYYFDAPISWLNDNPLPEDACDTAKQWRARVRIERKRVEFLMSGTTGCLVVNHSKIKRIRLCGGNKGHRAFGIVTEGDSGVLGRQYAFDSVLIDWKKSAEEGLIDQALA